MFNTFTTMLPVIQPSSSFGIDRSPVLIPFASMHPIFNVESLRSFLDCLLFNRVTTSDSDYQGVDFESLKDMYFELDEIDIENFYNDLIAVWQCAVLRTKPLAENETLPIVDLAGTSCGQLIGARFIDPCTFELFPYMTDVAEGHDTELNEVYIMVPGDDFGIQVTINPGILGVTSIEEVETGGHQIRLLDKSYIKLSEEEQTELIPFITNVRNELMSPSSNFQIFFNPTAMAQVVLFATLTDNLDLLIRYTELYSAYDEACQSLNEVILALGKPLLV